LERAGRRPTYFAGPPSPRLRRDKLDGAGEEAGESWPLSGSGFQQPRTKGGARSGQMTAPGMEGDLPKVVLSPWGFPNGVWRWNYTRLSSDVLRGYKAGRPVRLRGESFVSPECSLEGQKFRRPTTRSPSAGVIRLTVSLFHRMATNAPSAPAMAWRACWGSYCKSPFFPVLLFVGTLGLIPFLQCVPLPFLPV